MNHSTSSRQAHQTVDMPLGIHKPDNVAGSWVPAIAIATFVSFGGILFGYALKHHTGRSTLPLPANKGRYDTGTISGILAMDHWIKEFATEVNDEGKPYVTSSQQSLIVSILSAGTFFGALTAAPFGDFLGRRWGLIASCAVFSIGVVLQTAAAATDLFVAGRFIAGYGVGLVSALGIGPIYPISTTINNFL